MEGPSSLGKRKDYPVGYGADDTVPQEQSLARKKKRTLWDGGLSQISATDLAPPGTPPKQLSGPPPSIPPQDNSFSTPPLQTPPKQPGNPLLTLIKYYSPSVASPETLPRRSNAFPGPSPIPIPTGALPCQPVDPTSTSFAFPEHDWPKDVPLPVLCGHPIHPAYADSYNNVHCPVCIMETAMNDLKSVQEFILRQGGMSRWKENLINMNAYNMYNLLAVGGKKHKNANGTDVSWRHHMALVSNLISGLRSLSKMEQKWEARQSLANTTILFEWVRLRKQWSATSILQQYKDGVGIRFKGRLETDAEIFSRNRGRDWEVVADPAYPDYPPEIEDVKEGERFANLTDGQRNFIINSSVPQPKAPAQGGRPSPKAQASSRRCRRLIQPRRVRAYRRGRRRPAQATHVALRRLPRGQARTEETRTWHSLYRPPQDRPDSFTPAYRDPAASERRPT
jgi:hypothetical protein